MLQAHPQGYRDLQKKRKSKKYPLQADPHRYRDLKKNAKIAFLVALLVI
jgi:hypothetical protein